MVCVTHWRVNVTIQTAHGGWHPDPARLVATIGIDAENYQDALSQLRAMLPELANMEPPVGLEV